MVQTLRRLYLNAVLTLSALVALFSARALLRILIELGIGPLERTVLVGRWWAEPLAASLAGLVVAGVVWGAHAAWDRRLAAADPEERASLLRRLYLEGVGFVALMVAFHHLPRVLSTLLRGALGVAPDGPEPAAPLAYHLLAGLLFAAAYGAVRQAVAADEGQGPASPSARGASRLARYLAAAVGVATVGVQGGRLLDLFLRILQKGPAFFYRQEGAQAVAWLLGGLGLWMSTWGPVREPKAPEEAASTWRQIYLYGVTFVAAFTGLGALVGLLGVLLEAALNGESPSGMDLRPALAALVVAAGLWAYHWRRAQAEAPLCARRRGPGTARRLYHYFLAFLGLAFAVGGSGWLTGTLVEPLRPGDVALPLVLTVVGAAVWAWGERSRRLEELDPEEREAELRSPLRRGYRYLALFGAVVVILIDAAWILFAFLRFLLDGEPPEGGSLTRALTYLAAAGGVIAYSWRQLKADEGAFAVLRQAQTAEARPLLLVVDGDGRLAQALIPRLRERLGEEVELAGVALGPQAARAFDGLGVEAFQGRDAPDPIERARWILAPWHALLEAPAYLRRALWARSQALRLLPLPRPEGPALVGAPDPEAVLQAAVEAVGTEAGGEGDSPPHSPRGKA